MSTPNPNNFSELTPVESLSNLQLSIELAQLAHQAMYRFITKRQLRSAECALFLEATQQRQQVLEEALETREIIHSDSNIITKRAAEVPVEHGE